MIETTGDPSPEHRASRPDPPSGRGRVRMSAAQRREQLISVGRQVFAERGFDATSIEEGAAPERTARLTSNVVRFYSVVNAIVPFLGRAEARG